MFRPFVPAWALTYIRLICGAAIVPDLISPEKVAVMTEFLDSNYDAIMNGIDF